MHSSAQTPAYLSRYRYYLLIGFPWREADRLARIATRTEYVRDDGYAKDWREERENGWGVR